VGIIAEGDVILAADAPDILSVKGNFVTSASFRSDPPLSGPTRPAGELTFTGGFVASQISNMSNIWLKSRTYVYNTVNDPRLLLPNFCTLLHYEILAGKYSQ